MTELKLLKAIADKAKAMQFAALEEKVWYTFLPCEYGEQLDEAIAAYDKHREET